EPRGVDGARVRAEVSATYLQVHLAAQRAPAQPVALGVRRVRPLGRDLELHHRVPRVAELGLVGPAQVAHEGRVPVGGPQLAHADLHEGLLLGQRLDEQRVAASLPDDPAESPFEDPVLVGLIHHLPVNDPDGHDEEDGHAEARDRALPCLVHLLQSRVPCHFGDGARVPGARVRHRKSKTGGNQLVDQRGQGRMERIRLQTEGPQISTEFNAGLQNAISEPLVQRPLNNRRPCYLLICQQKLRRQRSIKTDLLRSRKKKEGTWSPLLRVAVALGLAMLCVAQGASAETLCGGELVDALQFVCEDRGFYFSRPTSRSNSRRSQKGIVEECCFQSCDLQLLEQYCAKPAKSERDVSATSYQAVPVLPVLSKEGSRKHVAVKYSKYEVWQRKAAQRLRRGVPAILRARNFRKRADKIQAQEQAVFHRPLITLPSKLPPSLPPAENYK
ncbi:insulin-like growth factor II, partial [Arapaima gigas]